MYQALVDKNVLITGATGLVGTCLVDFLIYLKEVQHIPIKVTVLSSSESNIRERFGDSILHKYITPLVQDIKEPLSNNYSFDFILHGASVANPRLYEEQPVDVIDTTIEGTRNILNYCKDNIATRVVYLSSVEVYGETQGINDDITEDKYGYVDPFTPRSSYTESKRLAETYCKAYSSQYGVNCSVARLSKTYGPSNSKSDQRVMAHILSTTAAGKNVVLNSDGSRVFSFCYVTDTAHALLTILLKGVSGEAYNVADRNSVASLKKIAQTAAHLAGVSTSFAESEGSSAISKDTVVDSTKLEKLGWIPMTNIEQGLKKQLAGFQN